jgi:multimeric flavodoxin WrbA
LKTLLIVYHSMTGGTRQMVEAAARAADEPGDVRVTVLPAREATGEHMLGADAYLFATPENLAAMSGQMKDFFDRSYYVALDQVNGRSYAAMICAGSDGRNAAMQIERIATGWRLKAIAPALIVCTHAQTPQEILKPKLIASDQLARCSELGATLAQGLALGIF